MYLDLSKRTFLKNVTSGFHIMYQQDPFTLDESDAV